MKKISKMADFQGTAASRVRIRHGYDPASHTIRASSSSRIHVIYSLLNRSI